MSTGRLLFYMSLLWGLFQVKLQQESIPFTAFLKPDGQFEYLVTPMKIANSPSCFNRLVLSVFSDYNSFCQTYFDGQSVFTPTDSVEEHLVALE